MSLTLKQMLDEVLLLSGVDTETSYVNQGTAEVERLVSLANRSAMDISLWPWQALRSRYSFTLSSDTQYALPADYRSIIPNTMFTDGEVFGADFPTETGFWSYLQASSGSTGARYQMRLLDGMLQVFQPDSGQSVSFEYLSNYPVLAADGTTSKQRFSADTDTFKLDDELLIRDTLWRYKKLVGFPDWQVDLADFRKYEMTVKGQDKSAQTLMPCEGAAVGEPYYNLWRPVPNV